MEVLGSHNAFWDDGEWISWDSLGDSDGPHDTSHLARLEYEARLRWRFPNADIALIPFFQDLLALAESYYHQTGQHLQVYGDIGELFGAITHGIKLHRNYAQGSDGRLGDDFVEIKTITPFNKHDRLSIRLDGNFNKLLVVKISKDFKVAGRLIDRKGLTKSRSRTLRLTWEGISEFG